MSRSRPTTPVRRVSRGSISSHLRTSFTSGQPGGAASSATGAKGRGSAAAAAAGNGQGTSGPSVVTPLSFLTQAMGDLSYETATLQSNLEAINEIQSALHTFDESFSMFLYGLKMNAFCVEWPEAPNEENFQRADMRKYGLLHNSRASLAPTPTDEQTVGHFGDATTASAPADQTYLTQDEETAAMMQRKPQAAVSAPAASHSAAVTTSRVVPAPKPVLKSAMKKTGAAGGTSQPTAGTAKTAKPTTAAQPVKITAAEKKRREAAAEEVIDLLPLEYRGSDPAAKQLAMRVLLALIAAGPKGVRINEIVRAPDLPQAKVNKCLIALVAAKQVLKRSENGAVYQLDPDKNPIAA